MDRKLVKIGEAAKLLGTSPDTLRKWKATGGSCQKAKVEHGYYDVVELSNLGAADATCSQN